jgi:mRNA-degrading endonuclease toxin of MazEF toxin-antitoxin module
MAKKRRGAISLQRGSIVWVFLDDPNGRPILDSHGNPKSRPVMVITPTEEILKGQPVSVAAISTQFDRRNLPPEWFLIPSQPGGDPKTGLDQPSVVKSNWLRPLDPSKIDGSHPVTRAPTQVVRKVLNWLDQQP